MKKIVIPYLICTVYCVLLIVSCKKNEEQSKDCFANEPTIRTLVNSQATIKKSNEAFYIIEQGSIDTKLDPCNLPEDFRVDNLQVIVTGKVKRNSRFGYGPCCTENFVIAKINK